MKSICEPFGRRPSEQLDRCQTYHVKVIKTRIGNTHAWVIPADDVPWFITTLAHDGMTPAVLRTHVLWTKEVRQVLADYFHRGVAHNPRVEAASQLNVQELEQRLVAAVTDALRPFISQTVGSAMQTHFQPLIETVNRLVARPADPPAPSPVQDSRNVRTTTTVDGKQVAKTAPRGKWHTIQQVHQNLSKFLAHSGVPTETAILTHIRVTGMFGELWQKYDTKRGDVWEEDTIKELRLHWKPSTDAGREVDFDISGKDIDDMLAGAGSV